MLRLSLKAVFRLQLVVLVATFTAAVIGILIASGAQQKDTRSAVDLSEGTQTVATGEGLLGDMLLIAARRASTFLLSPAFTSLDPSTQSLVRGELFRSEGDPLIPDVPPVEIPLSLNDGLTMQSAMDSLVERTSAAFATEQQDPTTVGNRSAAASDGEVSPRVFCRTHCCELPCHDL